MKRRYLLFVFLLIGYVVNAQLAGKKSKSPYIAVDGHTYKVGDVISIGYPTKGESYQNILYYKFESTFDSVSKILDVASGKKVEESKIYYAPKKIKETEGKIIYFRINDNNTYAILDYQDGYHIAILLDKALPTREVASNNPEYKEKLLENTSADFTDNSTKIKSFSSDFDIKLISAMGDTNQQNVSLTFLVSHKLVHQQVCFDVEKNNRLFDFNGNEYSIKNVKVGNSNNQEKKYSAFRGDTVCNKIPTNIPVKVVLTYNQILPSIKEFSFADIEVGYKPFDSNTYEYKYGNVEVNNIKVDWK